MASSRLSFGQDRNDHRHDSGHDHAHTHRHNHPAAAHPAQALSWSILRLTLAARLAGAAAVSAALWAIVVAAMR